MCRGYANRRLLQGNHTLVSVEAWLSHVPSRNEGAPNEPRTVESARLLPCGDDQYQGIDDTNVQ